MNYKELQTLCQEEFEGVRLILKKLKEKGIVSYEGIIPGYSAEIELKRWSDYFSEIIKRIISEK